MKKIIDGKIYNTDTATFIGNHQHATWGDFQFEDTDLYRTPKGAFFVQGTGGAYSRWSRPCGSNGQMGDRRLYPTDGATLSTAAYVGQYYALNSTHRNFKAWGAPYGNDNTLAGFYESLSDRVTVPEGEDSMEVCHED